jgi:hypothetical protein
LATAARLSSQSYDWRRKSISWLLYPRNDPTFHLFASGAIALTGLLIIPIVAYIRQRLASAPIVLRNLGAMMLDIGALLLIMAGLIVSHPYAGRAAFPRLHEMLARGAAIGLGTGMVMLWVAVLKIRFTSFAGGPSDLRLLVTGWSLLVIPAILVLATRVIAAFAHRWSTGVFRVIENRNLWHLGFWEWIGSGAVFLFFLTSALFLPESI